ncbi:sigma-70 family RNA polymerase sigma factor [Streptomyces sp. NBC_01092]|uniref:sigma-70 family RNA polymerase sigma factor n=1 Tax=Streptomyces sp. NBC_01092 TaxID=2903748 RepID=UPI00386DC4DD|nr:sigma-70 family RNA polymerase sigma factor [Streptomyces sp. NBC_01092]
MPASDAELTRAIRASGRHSDSAADAFEELYRRHHTAVLAYARTCCRDGHTAEDLASEAFARTLQAVQAGRGPEYAWRPYLLSVVRRTAADWAVTARRTDLSPDFEPWLESGPAEESGEERVLRQEDDALLVRGFRSLPERWQAVLWHTVVEGESAERVGALLGISPSGVGSLAARAREGLREAYLTAHIESVESAGRPECRHYSRLLATAVRRPGRRPNKDLTRHLDGCAGCRRAMMELTDLNERLRLVLPGALLLWAAPAYLASRLAEVGTAAGGAGHASVHLPKFTLNPLGAGLAAGAVIAAAAGGFLVLSHAGNDSRTAAPASAPGLSPTPSKTASPPRSSRPVQTRTPPPSGDSSLPLSGTSTVNGADRTGEMVSGVAADLCLDNHWASTADGSPITIYPCNGTIAQKVTVTSDHRLKIQGKCVDVSGGGMANGTPVQLFSCSSNNAAQVWLPQPDGSLLNPQSNKCLDDPGATVQAGTQLEIHDCNQTAAQRWRIP